MTDQADLVRLIYLDELFPRQAMRFHVVSHLSSPSIDADIVVFPLGYADSSVSAPSAPSYPTISASLYPLPPFPSSSSARPNSHLPDFTHLANLAICRSRSPLSEMVRPVRAPASSSKYGMTDGQSGSSGLRGLVHRRESYRHQMVRSTPSSYVSRPQLPCRHCRLFKVDSRRRRSSRSFKMGWECTTSSALQSGPIPKLDLSSSSERQLTVLRRTRRAGWCITDRSLERGISSGGLCPIPGRRWTWKPGFGERQYRIPRSSHLHHPPRFPSDRLHHVQPISNLSQKPLPLSFLYRSCPPPFSLCHTSTISSSSNSLSTPSSTLLQPLLAPVPSQTAR